MSDEKFAGGKQVSAYENYAETASSCDVTRVPIGIEMSLGLVLGPCSISEVRLLDVGCGTGSYAAVVYRHVDVVAALDLSAEMLAVARDKLPEDVVIEQAATDALPFDTGSFDAVMVNEVLHQVEDDEAARYPASEDLARFVPEEDRRRRHPGRVTFVLAAR